MQATPSTKSPYFGAIKISSGIKNVQKVSNALEKSGYQNIGDNPNAKIIENTTDQLKFLADDIREISEIEPHEFSKLYIMDTGDSYIIGHNIVQEHKMLPIVQKADPGARLNLGA